ncbi:hypothetical protein [Methylobacterium sp. J-076]|uniref:hypothetical protein n=1 Tax=Methylobacterium sp. J-076 TaxID=2836655 RepID=UPI001FBBEB65|nr:hypothetical protein [Methylobacterium sp. J-076]MCJ2015518.1 hypothetical protein [Methylobacterium sp. J-076]
MPLRPLALTLIACAATLGGAASAHAEDGFLDRLFGGTPGAAPANPFASNYPSAPPSPREVAAARTERAARRSRGAEAGPLPPGRIPEE